MMVRRSLVLLLSLGLLVSGALVSCSPAAQPLTTPKAVSAPTIASVPTAAPLPITVDVNRQADGQSVVHDLSNGYEFTLAQEWMAIPVAKEAIERVEQASPSQDPEFARLAQKLGEERTDAFRLVGINTNSQFANAANPTLLLVTAIPDKVSAALPIADIARMIEDTVFTSSNAVKKDVVHNANGVDVAVVEGPYDYLSTQGDTLKTMSKAIAFQANNRVVLIQFITPVQFGAEVLPTVDAMIDTIQRTKP